MSCADVDLLMVLMLLVLILLLLAAVAALCLAVFLVIARRTLHLALLGTLLACLWTGLLAGLG